VVPCALKSDQVTKNWPWPSVNWPTANHRLLWDLLLWFTHLFLQNTILALLNTKSLHQEYKISLHSAFMQNKSDDLGGYNFLHSLLFGELSS